MRIIRIASLCDFGALLVRQLRFCPGNVWRTEARSRRWSGRDLWQGQILLGRRSHNHQRPKRQRDADGDQLRGFGRENAHGNGHGENAGRPHPSSGPRADAGDGNGQDRHHLLPEKHTGYMVYPGLKAYCELPMRAGSSATETNKPPKVERTEIGKETIDGHPCCEIQGGRHSRERDVGEYARMAGH